MTRHLLDPLASHLYHGSRTSPFCLPTAIHIRYGMYVLLIFHAFQFTTPHSGRLPGKPYGFRFA